MQRLIVVVVLMGALCWGSAGAGSVSLQGDLPLSAADATAVYAYTFTLPERAAVILQTYGWGGSASAPGGVDASGAVVPPGGFDPYLSLFAGAGPAATFLVSNDDGPCPLGTVDASQCRDARISRTLPAGVYTVVLSAFENMSFAENLGTGTLGDGFVGIVPYDARRTNHYALEVITAAAPSGANPVPTLTGAWQIALSLLVLAGAFVHLRRH